MRTTSEPKRLKTVNFDYEPLDGVKKGKKQSTSGTKSVKDGKKGGKGSKWIVF